MWTLILMTPHTVHFLVPPISSICVSLDLTHDNFSIFAITLPKLAIFQAAIRSHANPLLDGNKKYCKTSLI